MTFAEAFSDSIELLAATFDRREAENIVRILGEDFFQVYSLHSQKNISDDQYALLCSASEKILEGIPLQYLTNRADFMGLEFYVNENVLIPRPETEELTDWIMKTFPKDLPVRILDIGTGSGCIPISLSKYAPAWKLDAIDISAPALEVAEENARQHHVKVNFTQKDILTASADDFNHKYDAIVSNPPYIGFDELDKMDNHVLKSEPRIALFAGEDPLVFYRKIASCAKDLLKTNGCLFFELNPLYAKEIKEICRNVGFTLVEVKKDMQGNLRMIKCCNS